MFSFPHSTTIALRPGLVAGRYPERSDPETGPFESLLNAVRGRLVGLVTGFASDLRRVAAMINRTGDSLAGLKTDELEGRVRQLRRDFHLHGLSDPLGVQAFALIREYAARVLGQRPYDVQLMGAWAILRGQLAEMETGEGKTLTAALAAAVAALAGIPVHVLTANEYLVKRDAEALDPLYRALGLSVGCVTHDMSFDQRRRAYSCDITYCTNKQIGFDYLRDRLLLGKESNHLRLHLESAYRTENRYGRVLLRGLCFAIVDEADSLLIDEARTPLILTRTRQGRNRDTLYRWALDLAATMTEGRDYYPDPARRLIRLGRAGQEKIAAAPIGEEGFLPRQREELVSQALYALHLLQRDRDYLVEGGKVLIIDGNTGRTMPDRAWERDLHQLIEVKEGCSPTEDREPLGRLTYQRFFRRYLRLGGMTGTAREVSTELWSVYGLRVRRIPLHRPCRRKRLPAQIHPTSEDKWTAVIASVRELHQQGRPVLIGTASVADSEFLAGRLREAGLAPRVLNARQDQQEAKIVARAGQAGQITVATNMAGRGTDIALGPGVDATGGLHVIATCHNEAGRIDRQLIGRCARQGDPGSYQLILSLEDDLPAKNIPAFFVKVLGRFTAGKVFSHYRLGLLAMRYSQKKTEGRHREARRSLLRQDSHLHKALAFTGNLE